MDIQASWNKALQNTEILRARVQALLTFSHTLVPYIILSESTINSGDTLVRKCEVVVEKPSLILPPNLPQFEGFESEEEKREMGDALANFLYVRGIRFPSLKYNNQTHSLDLHEGKLKESIEHFSQGLEREENVSAGLIVGPEDCWQFSLLIFISSQIVRQAGGDIKKMLDDFKKGFPS